MLCSYILNAEFELEPKTFDEAIEMITKGIKYFVVNKIPINMAVTAFKTRYVKTAFEVFKTKSQAAREIGFHRNSLIRNLPDGMVKKRPQMARFRNKVQNKMFVFDKGTTIA